MIDIFFGILGIGFLAFMVWGFIQDKKDTKLKDEIREKEKEEKENKFREFLNEINREKENDLLLFRSIEENNLVVELNLLIKSDFGGEYNKGIKCNINIIKDYIYILPIILQEGVWSWEILDYNSYDSYMSLKPNYKNLFFKIHINDVKFYKQNGTIYANTIGNINSQYSVGSVILTGNSAYKTNGKISTNLKDERTTEFYYTDNGIIKTLIFDGEALTKLQLIIPDKEKK